MVKSVKIQTMQEHDNDPRFARLAQLDESLRREVANGRIDIKSANCLSWLSVAEQRRVARWLDEDNDREIGPTKARRLLTAKKEGGSLDERHISAILKTRAQGRYIRVPMSKLPAGLSRQQAEQWLDRAIEEHKRKRR